MGAVITPINFNKNIIGIVASVLKFHIIENNAIFKLTPNISYI